MQRQCKGTTNTGKPCTGKAVNGGEYCWFHDPATEQDREKGRRLGGAARSNRSRARKQLESAAMTPAELQGVIGLTIKQVLSGKLPPNVGSAVAQLARAAVAIREAADFEERLAALEQADRSTYPRRVS